MHATGEGPWMRKRYYCDPYWAWSTGYCDIKPTQTDINHACLFAWFDCNKTILSPVSLVDISHLYGLNTSVCGKNIRDIAVEDLGFPRAPAWKWKKLGREGYTSIAPHRIRQCIGHSICFHCRGLSLKSVTGPCKIGTTVIALNASE